MPVDPHREIRAAGECEIQADAIIRALHEIDATMGTTGVDQYDRPRILAALRRVRGLTPIPEQA